MGNFVNPYWFSMNFLSFLMFSLIFLNMQIRQSLYLTIVKSAIHCIKLNKSINFESCLVSMVPYILTFFL